MSNYSGKLIVIDGTDGSGKTTQLKLLETKLIEAGYEVKIADFPQYNQKSAGLVEEYLSGKYGTAEEVTPYQASIFYAVDRFDASSQIRDWLNSGKIVLANRYTSANMGHQGGKIANRLARRAYFNWLTELEYQLFNIPQPDLTIILHLEAELAQQLAKDRARQDWSGSNQDIHENNLDHLKKAEEVYLEIAETYPEFKLISCSREGKILKREEIAWLVWLVVKKTLATTTDPIKVKDTKSFQAIGDLLGSNAHLNKHRDQYFSPAKETPTSHNLNSSTPELKLRVEKLDPRAKLPSRAHSEDAGFDLYSLDYYSLPPYSQATIATGLKIALPPGQVGLIWDKSGLAQQGIKTMGGVIDANYRGELKVIIKNLSEDVINFSPGQKIAQLIIQPLTTLKLQEENINDSTSRAEAGFGSTGNF